MTQGCSTKHDDKHERSEAEATAKLVFPFNGSGDSYQNQRAFVKGWMAKAKLGYTPKALKRQHQWKGHL